MNVIEFKDLRLFSDALAEVSSIEDPEGRTDRMTEILFREALRVLAIVPLLTSEGMAPRLEYVIGMLDEAAREPEKASRVMRLLDTHSVDNLSGWLESLPDCRLKEAMTGIWTGLFTCDLTVLRTDLLVLYARVRMDLDPRKEACMPYDPDADRRDDFI